MTAEVIVVPDETPETGSDSVAFAAGVAAAEAAQAGEEAEEAAAAAEVATEVAEVAVTEAAAAQSTAWAARDDVEQLRAEVGAGLDEIRGMLADLATAPAAESELTPERVERENGPGPDDDDQEEEHEPKRAGRYGSARWFSR